MGSTSHVAILGSLIFCNSIGLFYLPQEFLVYIPPQAEKANTEDELHDSIYDSDRQLSASTGPAISHTFYVNAHCAAALQPSPGLSLGNQIISQFKAPGL